jgi:hypothetical protein
LCCCAIVDESRDMYYFGGVRRSLTCVARLPVTLGKMFVVNVAILNYRSLLTLTRDWYHGLMLTFKLSTRSAVRHARRGTSRA